MLRDGTKKEHNFAKLKLLKKKKLCDLETDMGPINL